MTGDVGEFFIQHRGAALILTQHGQDIFNQGAIPGAGDLEETVPFGSRQVGCLMK